MTRTTFGKINAPEERWDTRTAAEERRITTKERAANYIALRRIGYNSGTRWQRMKRDFKRWLSRDLFTL